MDQVVQAHLEDMRHAYHRSLPRKVAALQAAWRASAEEAFSATSLKKLEHLAHELTGSGASFGLPEVSDLARGILDQCQDAPDSAAQRRIGDSLRVLEKLANQHAARSSMPSDRQAQAPKTAPAVTPGQPLIYLVDDDPACAESLATSIRQAGYDVVAMHDIVAFRQAMAARIPTAVVMDMMLREGALAGAQAITDHAREHSVPAIFISVREDFEARLAAVRAGAKGYLTKPVSVTRLLNLLDTATHRHAGTPYRVLIVEDNPSLATLYGRLLEAAQVEVSVLHTAVDALDTLDAFDPELLLLDVMLPDISGLEFGAVIRQCEKYSHIPIVFLTGDSAVGTRSEALQLGGDDFIIKPVAPEFLVESILARLARARNTRQGSLDRQQTLAHLTLMQSALDRHAIVSITDADGRITYVNECFCETSGHTGAELLGQNHRIVKSGLHDESFYEDMWRTLTTGQVWHGAISNRAKGGHIYDTITTIVPQLDAGGQPRRYFSIKTDVTALRQLQHQLDTQATHLSLALAATETGTWEWLRDSGDIRYSDSWRRLLGYATDEPDVQWHEFTHPDDFPANIEALKAHIDGITPTYSVQCRVRNARAEWDWVAEVGKVVERDTVGRPTRIVGTTQLINKRIAMERQRETLQTELIQAQKMEAMGHLAAGIAHDFNNMLGAMLGYAELSREMLERPGSTEKVASFLDEVMIAGTRAKDLIAQMLVFSRVNPAQSNATAVTLAQPVVKEVAHLLRSSIPTTIDVNYRIENDSLKVCIQPVHLHQIILNLGINARDAIGEYGKIEIGVARRASSGICASCSQAFDGEFVELTVHDSGHGIPEHQMDKVFDPFYTTKEVGKGTGMGLSVVHGVVHAAGGHIDINSRVGDGTTMRILLPEAGGGSEDPASEDAARWHSPADALAGLRILVVDDEQAMGAMLQELLSLRGATVTTFDRPVAALADFVRDPRAFDLVITDEAMPDLSGMDMARTMLKMRPALPVILCTGFSERATPETTQAAGIRGFMTKPVDINALVGIATQLTQQESK